MSSTFTRIPFTGYTARRNLAKNPVAGVDTTGYSGATPGGSVAVTREPMTSEPNTGVTSRCRVQVTVAGTTRIDAIYRVPTVVAGAVHSFSASVVTSGSGTGLDTFVQWRDAADAIISTVSASHPPVGGVWRRQTIGAGLTAPAGAVAATIIVRHLIAVAPVGAWVLMTAVLAEQASSVGSFFYGDTPNTTLERYGWEGSAHSSDSLFKLPNPAVDQVAPLKVLAPWIRGRRTRTIRHELMQSETVRVTFVPPVPAAGEFDALFPDVAAAKAAYDWFVQRREFYLEETALPAVPARFVVAGGELVLAQDEQSPHRWHVRIPWQEYPL